MLPPGMTPEDLAAIAADTGVPGFSAPGLPLEPWDIDAALNPADYGMVPEQGTTHQPDQYVARPDPVLTASPEAVQAGYAKRIQESAQPQVQPQRESQSQSSGTSQSQSMSHEGTNATTFDNFQNGKPAKGFDAKVAGAKDTRIAEANAMNANIGAAFDGQEGAAKARAAAEVAQAATASGDPALAGAAVQEMADAIGLAGVESTGLAQKAVAQASLAAKEFEETQKAIGKAEVARAQYTEQVNRVKSMKIDPFQLIGNDPMAYGLQNATAMMMAVSGKPGMQQGAKMLQEGILNAINKSVDAQMANLQNEQKVADGFKQVYDMVVTENDTATTARNKVYGAYLASMEALVESQMGQHDSEIINAQLGQTIAGIRTQRASVENQNYQDALKMAQDDAKIILSKYQSDQQASIEKMKVHEQRAQRQAAAQAAQQARNDKMLAGLAEGTVISPFDSDGGKVVGIVKDQFKEVMGQQSVGTARVQQMAEEMRELARRIEKEGDAGNFLEVRALNNDFKLRADALKQELSYSLARARDPGGRVTDKDQESAAASIGTNPRDWLRSDSTSTYDVVIKQSRKAWEEASQQYMKAPDLYNEAERAYMSADRGGYDPNQAGQAERELSAQRDKAALSPEARTPVAALKDEIVGVTKQDSAEVILDPEVAKAAGQKTKVPDWYLDYAQTDGGRFYAGEETRKTVKSPGSSRTFDTVRFPEWGQDLFNLSARADAGDVEAWKALNDVAGMDASGQFGEQAEMARWFIEKRASGSPNSMGDTDYYTRKIGKGNGDDEALLADR